MDEVLHAAILGLVQGLTEFLPVSSSAHLILVPRFLGWNDPFVDTAAFDVMLHVGTLIALLLYFWRDILRLIGAFFGSLRERSLGTDPERRLAWLLLVSVVPAALLGAALESFFDTFFRERVGWIAIFLATGAALLWLAERWGAQRRGVAALRFPEALAIGVAQALALFPGMSRSGITIGAGLFLGLERAAAARFAFLMGIPVIAGAGLLKGRELASTGIEGHELALVVGVVVSAVSGLAAIAFLLAYLRRNSTAIFIAYRVVLAGFVVVLLLAR
ncbi:MAG: undecaprenyl-diphosphatase UppP [Chloroflexi bacterium]|nr:MAG: undecaprenyl-diphosphatase UppP [Chloroflexota bacterium]